MLTYRNPPIWQKIARQPQQFQSTFTGFSSFGTAAVWSEASALLQSFLLNLVLRSQTGVKQHKHWEKCHLSTHFIPNLGFTSGNLGFTQIGEYVKEKVYNEYDATRKFTGIISYILFIMRPFTENGKLYIFP